MTREERAREILRAAYVAETGDDAAASYYWSMAFEDMTVEDRYAITAMLAFADAEAAAMRERAAELVDADMRNVRDHAVKGDMFELAAAIRALPATGEVGRG